MFFLAVAMLIMAFVGRAAWKPENSEKSAGGDAVDLPDAMPNILRENPPAESAIPDASSAPTPLTPENAVDDRPVIIPPPLRTVEDVFDYNGLIDISELNTDIVLDIRYATAANFTGVQQYEFPLALMQKEVAVMLLKAQELALRDGFLLRIYDAYRPLSVQQSLYDATPAHLREFVAKPTKTARHCIGVAIDCGLSDLDGNEVIMPSAFDEFAPSAYADYSGGTAEQRKNRDYLIDLMQSCGFSVYSKEWWHYNAPVPDGAEAMDISCAEFDALRKEM
jgi:D-alanyl-D-alanine dipeptidase